MCSYHLAMVPLNYNFISTWVDARGNMQYFVCKMPKFSMENIISTRRGMAFPQDKAFPWHMAIYGRHKTWHFYETSHGIYMRRGQLNSFAEKPTGITTVCDLLCLHGYIFFSLCLLYSWILHWPVTISAIKNISYVRSSLKCALLKCCLDT